METDPSLSPLHQLSSLHREINPLDCSGQGPEPADCAAPAEALASVERLQRELGFVRLGIMAPSAPVTMGERAVLSHHVQVIDASLRLLHNALRRNASGS
jgi:hypothetical protein